jgi:hypothetical protein
MLASRRSILKGGLILAGSIVAKQSGSAETMPNIVLIGDSTLDNAAYVAAGQDVSEQLRRVLPAGWEITLLARDGDVVRGVETQLERVPADATHLIISVGGNDALRDSGVLSSPARSVAEALDKLATIREGFATDYRAMLDRSLARGLPTAICTIYEAAFPDASARRLAATALTVLNDIVTREAATRGIPLIDLRVLFSSSGDYANAIEPSGEGGRKFAASISALVAQHDFERHRCEIFVSA